MAELDKAGQTKKKAKKEQAPASFEYFNKREFRNRWGPEYAPRTAWVGWGGIWNQPGELRDGYESVDATIQCWRKKLAEEFPEKLFEPFTVLLQPASADAGAAMFYENVYFLRYWLDYLVRMESSSYWCFVHDLTLRRELDKLSLTDDRKFAFAEAIKAADNFVKPFREEYA